MYIVYRAINVLTLEYYIGVHLARVEQDDYLGSGLRLKRSVKKYGKRNFIRETLISGLSEQEAFLKEEEILEKCLGDKLKQKSRPGTKDPGRLFHA